MNTSLVLSLPTVILAGLGLAGLECHAPAGPDELPPPTFVAQPETVAPGDTFAVAFTLRNPTRRTVTISSSYGCLFFLRAFRGSDPISMQGATYACTTAFQSFELAPGDSLHVVHRLVAAERNYPQAPTPLPAGTYRIQTQMNAALPDMEAVVTVVGPAGPDELPPPTFVAQPATVARGDTFAVVFTLRNPNLDTVRIGSAYGCLFFLRAFRGSDPVAMEGTRYGCTAAFRTFKVPPRDSLRIVHELVAAELTPLPAGTYRVQTQMNAALPDLEAEVTVVDPAGAQRFK